MPIGDLLASITGEGPSPSPTSATRPDAAALKRKAADELRPAPATKAPRTGSPSTASSRLNGNSPRPLPLPAGKLAGSLNSSQRASNSLSQGSKRPPGSIGNGVRSSPAGKPTSSGKSIPSRPLFNRPVNTDSGPKPEQKKGSFAEILARAKANSELRESFGKIQHKAIEKKPLTMKERKLQKAEEARQMKLAAKKSSSGYTGTGSSSRSGASRPGQRLSSSSKSMGAKDKTPPAPEVKKVKKAALATTGYTGTARPRPGAAAKKTGTTSRSSRDEERERPRYPGAFSRPRRRDEDDDLDDFIDYDDEEEDVGGYGHRQLEYDSAEDESDMEAGLSDIDEEERRAERQARIEDIKELELEKRLKEEKRRRLAGRA